MPLISNAPPLFKSSASEESAKNNEELNVTGRRNGLTTRDPGGMIPFMLIEPVGDREDTNATAVNDEYSFRVWHKLFIASNPMFGVYGAEYRKYGKVFV